MNIFHSNPRGDTIVHWLRGGVYPREDQLKAIQGLPRTLDVMPVVHNFGHVAVAGCCFYHSGALNPDWRGHLFVAHFNTRRIARGIYRIRRAGGPAKVEPWGAATEKVWELARKGDAASARQLAALLTEKDVSVAHAAGNALASLANSAADDALVATLSHKDPG